MSRKENCPHCEQSLRGNPILSRVDRTRGYAIRSWDANGPIVYYDAEGQPIKSDGQHCHDENGTALFYWDTIGIEIKGVYDGVLFWECPHCGGRWHKFAPGDRLYERAAKYVAAKREQPWGL